jgi:hypothetical protein
MRCYNARMLWIIAQTFVTIAITVAFGKIVKASLRTSIGLGMFYAGYEMALVGVITGHIESCHFGMFVVLCGTILILAKLSFPRQTTHRYHYQKTRSKAQSRSDDLCIAGGEAQRSPRTLPRNEGSRIAAIQCGTADIARRA